jgi:energy-coupling factor transporter ATP-binding protein EcfA2
MKKIKSIKVINSKFFEKNFYIRFSEKLNCIMGSRGTGKSTLLYFIKSIVSEEGESDKITNSILSNNLGQGTIILNFEDDDGKNYIIEKLLNDEPQPYIEPSKKHISINKIKNKITCDIYEALAIEKIGLDSYGRLALIDKMVKEKEDVLLVTNNLKIELKQNAIDVKSEVKRESVIIEKLQGYTTAIEDLEEHKKEAPKEVGKKENEEFKTEESNEIIRSNETRTLKEYLRDSKSISSNFDEEVGKYEEHIEDLKIPNNFLNTDIIDKSRDQLIQFYEKACKTSKDLKKELDIIIKSLNEKTLDLKERHEKQHNEYVKIKQKFDKNKKYYDKYEQLSKKIEEKKELDNELEKIRKRAKKYIETRRRLVKELTTAHRDLYERRLSKVKELNKFLNGEVIVTLTEGGITNEYDESLKFALKGSRMRYSVIGPKIINNFKPSEFAEIIFNKEEDKLKAIDGIDKERAEDLIKALYQSDEIYDIEILHCQDLPEFKLRVEDKQKVSQTIYKETELLSTGQRCTAVLPIIFAVSNNPLIIDQPEDNLDNRYITDTIHDIIKNKKLERQLIFITHNPNIPVLSNAEHNVFLTYEDQKSFIKDDCHGNVEDVKNNIIRVLEGGEKAFLTRKEKYGF